jgi:hypothetical protein
VTFDGPILDELFVVNHGTGTGGLQLPQLDSHMPLTMVKVAVLLAQLEGRRHVTVEDWRLARIVWQTSCRVRDHLIAYGVALQGKESAARRAAYAGQEAAAEAARAEVRDIAEQQRVARMADRVEAMLREAGQDGMALGAMRKRFASKERPLFGDALDMAILRGRALLKHDGSTERVVPL